MTIRVDSLTQMPLEEIAHQHAKPLPPTPVQTTQNPTIQPHTIELTPKAESLEDIHIKTIGQYLHSQAAEMLFGNCSQECFDFQTKHLKTLLEPTKAILSPSPLLQFYRHFAQQLLSEKNTFEWSFETSPSELPLPLSVSWIPHQPYVVKIANPMLRALFTGALTPNEYQKKYLEFFSHFLPCSINTPQNHSQFISFSQASTSYHFALPPASITLLFFPQFAAQMAYNLEGEKVSQTFTPLIFSSYAFTMTDRRLTGLLKSQTTLIDSLLISETLSSFPTVMLQSMPFKEKLLQHLAFLIRHAILDNELMLSGDLVTNIFRLATVALADKKAPYEEDEISAYFYYYLFHAYQLPRIEKMVRHLDYFQKNGPLPLPLHLEKHAQSKDFYFTIKPESSFLLRDLQRSWTNNKGSQVQNGQARSATSDQAEIIQDVNSLTTSLCKKLIRSNSGVHVIIIDPQKTAAGPLRELLLEQSLFQMMHDAWKFAISQNLREPLTQLLKKLLAKHQFGLSVQQLRLVALLPWDIVCETYWQAKVGPTRHSPHNVATIHITRLVSNNLYSIQTITEAILKACLTIKPMLSQEALKKKEKLYQYNENTHPIHSFIHRLDALIALCQTKAKASEICAAVNSCFTAPSVHANKTTHRELFCLMFFFAAHLCQIRLNELPAHLHDLQLNENCIAFASYSSDQISICIKESDIVDMLTRTTDANKPHILLIDAKVLKKPDVIQATKKNFSSITFYGDPLSFSSDTKETVLALTASS